MGTRFPHEVLRTIERPLTLGRTFVASRPGVLERVESWASSVDSVIMHTGTLKADFLETLPTEIRQVYSNYVNAQVSIAAKGGIVIHMEGRTGAAPGSIAVHAAAAAVAGLLLIIAVL